MSAPASMAASMASNDLRPQIFTRTGMGGFIGTSGKGCPLSLAVTKVSTGRQLGGCEFHGRWDASAQALRAHASPDEDRRGEVLDRGAHGLEHGDLVVPGAACV